MVRFPRDLIFGMRARAWLNYELRLPFSLQVDFSAMPPPEIFFEMSGEGNLTQKVDGGRAALSDAKTAA